MNKPNPGKVASLPRGKQNLSQDELLLEIYKNTHKTQKYIVYLQILSVIKTIIIVVPIILAIIYLPPYFEKISAPYRELLEASGELRQDLKLDSINDLINIYK